MAIFCKVVLTYAIYNDLILVCYIYFPYSNQEGTIEIVMIL